MTTTQKTTDMLHVECHACGMTATFVATDTAHVAWSHHMDTHARPEAFSAWTWTVVALPFE